MHVRAEGMHVRERKCVWGNTLNTENTMHVRAEGMHVSERKCVWGNTLNTGKHVDTFEFPETPVNACLNACSHRGQHLW